MSETARGQGDETTFRSSGLRALRIPALLLNASSVLIGVYFASHARDRRDVLSAVGVAAASALNVAALGAPLAAGAESLLFRLRRIALFVNTLLLVAAVAFILLEAARGWRRLALHSGLLLPPLFTIAALLSAWPFSAARASPASGRD